jgi:hypothetical protein
VLARHLANVMAVQTARGGQRITKGKQRRTRNQIDGAVALAMAVDRAKLYQRQPDLLPITGGEVEREDRKGPEFRGIRGQDF